MRFLSGFLTVLVVGASAMPQATQVPEPFAWEDTCAGVEGKTQKSWQESGLGEWFVVMANAQDKYDKDIQKTILSWEKNPSLYGFYCAPMAKCEANFDINDCLDPENSVRPRIYFLLWSIANLNNWMASLLTAVAHTAGVADGLAGDMVQTFATNDGSSSIATAGASLAGGILGSIAAIFPAASVVAGFGSGLGTLAGGIVTQINEEKSIDLEPKFNDFADITKYIAQASETMQTGIEKYTKWLLTEIPANDRANGEHYVDDPKSLPNVLLNGDFAEPRTSPNLPDGIYVSLFSAAISLLWKQESAVVIKIPHDTPILSTPACEDTDLFAENKWCDDEGNAYLLLAWQMKPKPYAKQQELIDRFKKLKGVDKLGDYRLSIETVVKASEHAASLNGGAPYYEWNAERVIAHMSNNVQNMVEFSGFNLPFCEITNDKASTGSCNGECQILYSLLDCFHETGYEEFGVGEINLECTEYECNAGE